MGREAGRQGGRFSFFLPACLLFSPREGFCGLHTVHTQMFFFFFLFSFFLPKFPTFIFDNFLPSLHFPNSFPRPPFSHIST